ncbi:MAG: ComF family protein [Pirellulaceae bacterium]|nr:ComF family protein [Pirellulaceae bacterium]
MMRLSAPLSWAINLVLPPECAWCQRAVADDQPLCDECRQVFTTATSCCQRCAMPVPEVVDRSACVRCRDAGWRFDRVVALGPYRGRLREAIILIKKPAFEALATSVGQLLGDKLLLEQINPDVILPVPNHWTRRLAHRTSTAETIASAIAGRLRKPLWLSAMQRVKRTKKQGMLAWSNRPANVQHAFRVRRPKRVAERHILIVDDVFTSGATAAEMTRCLLKAGASRVTIAVAARGTGSRS